MTTIPASFASISQDVQRIMAPVFVAMKYTEDLKSIMSVYGDAIAQAERDRQAVLAVFAKTIKETEDLKRRILDAVNVELYQKSYLESIAPLLATAKQVEQLHVRPAMKLLASASDLSSVITAQMAALNVRSIAPALDALRAFDLDAIGGLIAELPDGPETTEEDLVEIQHIVAEAANRPIGQSISYLIEVARKQKPKAKKALLWVITVWIALLLQDVYHWTRHELWKAVRPNAPAAEVVREASEVIRELKFAPSDLKDFRVIVRKTNILENSRRPSSVVAKLQPGSIVYVIEKNGKWCIVEWHDPATGCSTEGWVRSKHLRRLKP